MRLAFDLVRGSAWGNPAVLRRLLRAIALAASQVHTPDRLLAQHEQVALVMACAQATLSTDYERHEVQCLHNELRVAWG